MNALTCLCGLSLINREISSQMDKVFQLHLQLFSIHVMRKYSILVNAVIKHENYG